MSSSLDGSLNNRTALSALKPENSRLVENTPGSLPHQNGLLNQLNQSWKLLALPLILFIVIPLVSLFSRTSLTRLLGRGRPGPHRQTQTVSQVRYVMAQVQRNETAIQERKHRLGWRNHITNLPPERMSLSQTVAHYRGGWALENDFHLLKDRPLGISPLFVRLDDQILGLTRLLTLALHLLTLIQTQVRSSLQQTGEVLAGLYEGQPNRITHQPTATRLLKAVSKQEMTLTRIVMGQQCSWHLTPLTDLLFQVLNHLDILPSAYLRLADNSP